MLSFLWHQYKMTWGRSKISFPETLSWNLWSVPKDKQTRLEQRLLADFCQKRNIACSGYPKKVLYLQGAEVLF